MSSLAATQADGMYIPPEYLESGAYKKKSISQFAGSKGHNQYLTRSVCRFELPFDGFCTKCDAIVGKGTRFNAHKAHVDDYFTTKIYEFTTRCRACGKCEFKIRTNPKDRTFDYVSGIRKKVEEFDSAEAGTHGVIDTEFGNGILQYKNGKVLDDNNDEAVNAATHASALHLLEKHVSGHRKVQTEHEQMTSLIQLNSKMVEDADANALLRATYRKERKAKKRRLGEAVQMGLGGGIELAGESMEDEQSAKKTMRGRYSSDGHARKSEMDKFNSVRGGSIFSSASLLKKNKSSSKGQKKRSSKCEILHSSSNNNNETSSRSTSNNEKAAGITKRKITISTQNLTGVHSKKAISKVNTADSSPRSSGALAALSSCYASDSD